MERFQETWCFLVTASSRTLYPVAVYIYKHMNGKTFLIIERTNLHFSLSKRHSGDGFSFVRFSSVSRSIRTDYRVHFLVVDLEGGLHLLIESWPGFMCCHVMLDLLGTRTRFEGFISFQCSLGLFIFVRMISFYTLRFYMEWFFFVDFV